MRRVLALGRRPEKEVPGRAIKVKSDTMNSTHSVKEVGGVYPAMSPTRAEEEGDRRQRVTPKSSQQHKNSKGPRYLVGKWTAPIEQSWGWGRGLPRTEPEARRSTGQRGLGDSREAGTGKRPGVRGVTRSLRPWTRPSRAEMENQGASMGASACYRPQRVPTGRG